jgi:transcriptional regulator with XRE-family HTH domain
MSANRARERSRGRARHASVEEDVGRKLRAQREERGLSLRELARRLGMSPSAISQIETGKSRPSVSTLYAIVSELRMSLDELFDPAAPHPPTAAAPAFARGGADTAEGHVQRRTSRRAIDLETGVRWEQLTSDPDPAIDFLYVTYEVGGSSSQDDRFIRHAGREYGLVLSGTLEVSVGFERYVLGPGDSISFDSTVPHCLRNAGAEPVTGVWLVLGRQNDIRVTG